MAFFGYFCYGYEDWKYAQFLPRLWIHVNLCSAEVQLMSINIPKYKYHFLSFLNWLNDMISWYYYYLSMSIKDT